MGEMPISRAKLKGRVQVGPVTLDSPDAMFTDVIPNANVGSKLLRQMVITIDPSGKRSWATVAGK